MFKMALDRTPSDRELCSQSTISRLENLPDVRALLRMGRAMVDLYCGSFAKVPKRITLDIDDTFDAVHGGQQLRLFNAHYDEYGFQPIVVFDGEGRFVTAMWAATSSPQQCSAANGASGLNEIALVWTCFAFRSKSGRRDQRAFFGLSASPAFPSYYICGLLMTSKALVPAYCFADFREELC